MADQQRFTVLKDFGSEELKSLYLTGFSYRVTPQNAKFVKEWLDKKLVVMGAAAPAGVGAAKAKLGGAGKVK
jgi:hypothetical protein